jgi:hypothetical protein
MIVHPYYYSPCILDPALSAPPITSHRTPKSIPPHHPAYFPRTLSFAIRSSKPSSQYSYRSSHRPRIALALYASSVRAASNLAARSGRPQGACRCRARLWHGFGSKTAHFDDKPPGGCVGLLIAPCLRYGTVVQSLPRSLHDLFALGPPLP